MFDLRGGLIPAVPVPFDSHGAIHREAMDRYVDYMAGRRVRGVAVWAHTGRGLLLSDQQRRDVLNCWRRGFPGPIIAGIGARAEGEDETAFARFTDETARMAEQALRGGADALLVHAPTIFRHLPSGERDRRVVEHHRALDRLGAPLVLFFLYEAAGGVTYSPAVLEELFSLPNVVGIKMATLDSVMTFQDVARLIRERFPATLLITGEDRFLGYSLLCGAEAALVGMAAACPEPQIALLDAYAGGAYARFVDLARRLDAFAQATFVEPMEGYVRRMLWAAAVDGVIPRDAAHDPFGPDLDASDLERVERAVVALRRESARESSERVAPA